MCSAAQTDGGPCRWKVRHAHHRRTQLERTLSARRVGRFALRQMAGRSSCTDEMGASAAQTQDAAAKHVVSAAAASSLSCATRGCRDELNALDLCPNAVQLTLLGAHRGCELPATAR